MIEQIGLFSAAQLEACANTPKRRIADVVFLEDRWAQLVLALATTVDVRLEMILAPLLSLFCDLGNPKPRSAASIASASPFLPRWCLAAVYAP